jgi:hypothetical protein
MFAGGPVLDRRFSRSAGLVFRTRIDPFSDALVATDASLVCLVAAVAFAAMGRGVKALPR